MKSGKNIVASILAGLIGVAGLYFLALFINNIIHRIGFPYPIEYLEDAIFFHALRIHEGQPLYTDPNSGFAAIIYAPGYFYLLAGMFKITGPSIVTARIISLLCTLSIFGIIIWQSVKYLKFPLVLVPPAIYLTLLYSHFAGYQDLGRVDPLMFLLVIVGAFIIGDGRKKIATTICGVLLISAAAYIKQPALAYLPFLYLFLILRDRKNGFTSIALSLGFLLITFIIANAATSGWFGYYTLAVPMSHTIHLDRMGIMIFGGHVHYPVRGILYLLMAFVIYLLARLAVKPRQPVHILEAILPGSVIATTAPFLKEGGYFQDFIPLYTHLCLLLPLALSLPFKNETADSKSRNILLNLQTVILICLIIHTLFSVKPLYEFREAGSGSNSRIINPWTEFVPADANIKLGDDFVEKIREIDGEVLMPSLGYYGWLAGKEPGYIGVALTDLLGVGERPQPLLEDVGNGRYAAICLPEYFPAASYWNTDLSNFGYEGPVELIENPMANYNLSPNIERPPNNVYILK